MRATGRSPRPIPTTTFRGKGQIRSWFERFHQIYPERHFELQDVAVGEPLAFGASNEIAVRWWSRLRDQEGTLAENEGMTMVHVRGRKAIRVHDFIFDLSQPFFNGQQR